MFLELIALCKCNFSSFHNLFFMQVQVGVLPELIFEKASCYASAFFIYSRILGTQLGLRHCREDLVGMFALENQSH